jgi:2'-5' RNA ligase
MTRLFLAIDPPQDVRRQLASLRSGVADARWVSIEQLHLTLKFLGDVEEAAAAEVEKSLDSVRETDFALELSGVGRFPPRRAARVLWAGLKAEPKLLDLHEAIELRLEGLGIEREDQAFSPHLTLARLRDNVRAAEVERWLERGRNFLAGPFPVGRFHLYSSVLGPDGATHERIHSYELA